MVDTLPSRYHWKKVSETEGTIYDLHIDGILAILVGLIDLWSWLWMLLVNWLLVLGLIVVGGNCVGVVAPPRIFVMHITDFIYVT